MHNSSKLAGALERLGVEFLLPRLDQDQGPDISNDDLIAGLACSSEARLRLALIPLFLQCPQLASLVPAVFNKLPRTAQITLQCYYLAAFYLRRKYSQQLEMRFGTQTVLQPLFLEQMGLPVEGGADKNLSALAREHQLLSGRLINWYGTYEHAARRLLAHREREQA